jgi:DNA-binding winged helix-turn-helix (wHTH) protein/Tol biopolymer transport system component
MAQPSKAGFQFAEFSLDIAERRLLCRGECIPMTPKVFDTLHLLVENAGHLVEKETFLKHLWPDAFVEESSLARNISVLRKILGDDGNGNKLIETVPKRGYRFAAEVRELVEESSGMRRIGRGTQPYAALAVTQTTKQPKPSTGEMGPKARSESNPHRFAMLKAYTFLVAVLVAGVSLAWYRARSLPSPSVRGISRLTNDGRAKFQGYEQPLLLTDGSRIYFVEMLEGGFTLAQIPVSGGETSLIASPFSQPQILDFDRGHSSFLLLNWSGHAELEAQLWTFPLLSAGSARVGNLVVSGAALSPKGEDLVYTRESSLYLAHADGSDAHELVKVVGRPGKLHWSPDGKTLRFTVADPETRSTSLWEVSSDGSRLRPLLREWNKPSRECCGVWTGDGRYFVFQSFRNNRWEIWAIREKVSPFRGQGPEPVRLTAGPMDFYSPAPSEDGKKLYVVGALKRGELMRYDAATQGFVPYFSGLSAEGVDFSADGMWVTYTLYPEGTLWRSRLDGSERHQLTTPPMWAFLPRWSPDGKEITFMGAAPGKPWKIFKILADGGSPEELLPGAMNEFDPTWSSDGKQLAFGSPVWTVVSAAARPVAIYLLDLETRRVSKVPGSEGFFSPRWSPDGTHLAAVSSDSQSLMLFDFADGKWSQLAAGGVTFPRWARDSKYIYWDGLGEDAFVRRARIADRAVERVASLKNMRKTGAMGSWAGSTPDGSPLLLRFANSEEIYALDLNLP